MSYSENNTKNAVAGKFLKGVFLNAIVILAVTAALLIVSVGAAGSTLISSEIFPDGTSFDGIDISGLTYEEGREIIKSNAHRRLDSVSVELDYDGNLVALTASELCLDYDVDAVLEQLIYTETDGAISPYNYVKAVFASGKAGNITTTLVYDREKIIAALEAALQPYDKAPENAQAVFDRSGAVIEYSGEIPGRKARTDLMADAIVKYLEEDDSSLLAVEYDIMEAEITQAALKDNTVLIGECITQLPDNEIAGINIGLACDELSGTPIQPGDTLSLSGLLGGRGRTDDIDGGISQLAGTLYNAALLADMEIVRRASNTYMPDYLPVGLDAAVDGHDKDLQIKNNSDYAIYVCAVMDTGRDSLTVRLYGQPPADGIRIEIVTEQIREIAPEGETVELTDSLPPGKREAKQPAITGREVRVHRNYYLDNELIYSELISQDIYNARAATVLLGIDYNIK